MGDDKHEHKDSASDSTLVVSSPDVVQALVVAVDARSACARFVFSRANAFTSAWMNLSPDSRSMGYSKTSSARFATAVTRLPLLRRCVQSNHQLPLPLVTPAESVKVRRGRQH